MPNKPSRPCPGRGARRGSCSNLVQGSDRYCALCASIAQAEARQEDRQRGTASERGYGYRWQQATKGWLRSHPLCVVCSREATLVDHIIPHRGDMTLFWDSTNWQSMCDHCHNVKRQRESRAWEGASKP